MDYSKKTKQFWRRQIKKRGVQALGGKCAICGGVFEDCCYDFHHLDPSQKDFTISDCNTNGARSWPQLRDEIKKCALLCANCHRLYHNNFIDLDCTANYFIEEYYEWDWCDETAFNTTTGEPIRKNTEIITCPVCGGPKGHQSKVCINCSNSQQRQYEVSREELKELIYNLPLVQVGKKFGVSDNAIRKRCISYGLPSKKSEIKKYSKEEWDKI